MNKTLSLVLMACFFISIIFASVYKFDNERIIHIGKVSSYHILQKEHIVIIDSVDYSKPNKVHIYGCALDLKENLDYANNKIVLIDNENNIFLLKTRMVKRPSATEYFNNGFNYDNSGIQALGKITALKKGSYKIGLLVTEKDRGEYLLITDNLVELR